MAKANWQRSRSSSASRDSHEATVDDIAQMFAEERAK
jgi:hypothetical protein